MSWDPRLAEMHEAFEQGDFWRVRQEALRLARDPATDSDVKAAAADLARLAAPPVGALPLVALPALLLVFVAVWWILVPHLR